jgi:hypothetical protein
LSIYDLKFLDCSSLGGGVDTTIAIAADVASTTLLVFFPCIHPHAVMWFAMKKRKSAISKNIKNSGLASYLFVAVTLFSMLKPRRSSLFTKSKSKCSVVERGGQFYREMVSGIEMAKTTNHEQRD